MDEAEIRKAVLETLKAIAPELDAASLRPDQPLRRQVDLDSMDWLNVVAGLHDMLHVDLAQGDPGSVDTLDELLALVGSRLSAGAAAADRASVSPSDGLGRNHRLPDGRQVCIRPIRPDDAQREADFVRHLSSESRYGRFMVGMAELSPTKLRYLTNVDNEHHVALVATEVGSGKEIEVAVARYVVTPGTHSCEFAIAVDDAWQGSGLAGILMADLMEVARSKGISQMEGFVLASNHKMLKFVRQLGFGVKLDPEDRQTVLIARPL